MIQNILFLDIETVPQYSSFEDMPENMRQLWERKSQHFRDGKSPAESYPRAGIYAEFGKVICIGCAYFDATMTLQFTHFSGDDEFEVLNKFSQFVRKRFSRSDSLLCAHNGKEFDFPFLCRRFLVNNIRIPQLLHLSGRKPWEVPHLDTMEMWKFGDYKAYTSLTLLASTFGIPSPKDDMDGSMVWKVYWHDNDLDRIVKYCMKDVECLVEVYLRLSESEGVGVVSQAAKIKF